MSIKRQIFASWLDDRNPEITKKKSCDGLCACYFCPFTPIIPIDYCESWVKIPTD